MRGGDRYPILVRKTEPKPIRVFMQDGSNDQLTDFLGEVGDWWLSNQTMESALRFAGYPIQHVWGEGSHNGKHATAVFPDAMRWLWKDWPQLVTAGESKNVLLGEILLPGEAWKPVRDDEWVRALRAGGSGSHEFLGSQGRVYRTVTASGEVWLSRSDGTKTLLDRGLKGPTGIALSPDGLWLAVAESQTHWRYSYLVRADGTVQYKQLFYWFHVPDEGDDSGAGAWAMGDGCMPPRAWVFRSSIETDG